MILSVIIPTFRRPEFLEKAFRGLEAQERAADQIVVGMREEDVATAEFLARRNFPCEVVKVRAEGVVASMAAAAQQTHGDIVAFLDDDSEPLPDWLARMEKRFSEDARLGLLGGRDLLQDHPEMRAREPRVRNVGIFTWYGRILGNHHRGGGAFRRVDFIKGCNAGIRGHLLRLAGFEQGLRGEGAQVHWEVALALDVQAAGFNVAYDPEMCVIHHIAPRFGKDQTHRGGFSAEALYDMVWNEHFVVGTRVHGWRNWTHGMWALGVGSLDAPGIVQFVRNLVRRDPRALTRFQTTLRAMRDGRHAARAAARKLHR